MNINETTTDFEYIETEIKKISMEYGLDSHKAMQVFTNIMLNTGLDSDNTLDWIRDTLSKTGVPMYKTIKDWMMDHDFRDIEPYLLKRFRETSLSKQQILDVLSIFDETCHECMDAPAGCQCWNDE